MKNGGSQFSPSRPATGTLRRQRKEIPVDAAPTFCWDVLRDVGAPHTRLVPGFVTATVLEADARVVTFGNGIVARELIVDLDDEDRRIVWSVVRGAFTHHNASVQVFDDGRGGSRLVWIADLLPRALAPQIRARIDHAASVLKPTLESGARSPMTAAAG